LHAGPQHSQHSPAPWRAPWRQECECKSGGKSGKSSWVLPADAAGVAGRGRLEVSFASHSLYPFQPPTRLAYRNDALPFAKQAAICGALSRQACNLTGAPLPSPPPTPTPGQLSAAQGNLTSCLNFDFAILNLFEPSAL
jgi:hypothetical protein